MRAAPGGPRSPVTCRSRRGIAVPLACGVWLAAGRGAHVWVPPSRRNALSAVCVECVALARRLASAMTYRGGWAGGRGSAAPVSRRPGARAARPLGHASLPPMSQPQRAPTLRRSAHSFHS
jgi:hypothetical protein